ncbi:retrovirus-related pol polyprotein from transposon TNT 1-94 [Tanacetum coccineum]
MAMQEELNQFVTNDVWSLVPPPNNETIIGTKWVFKNKSDENGVVSQNKARLVAQGYNLQEGIDFDETYAPIFEMSMMGELNFFLGLQIKQLEDGMFFNQSKYIKEMLKKFGLEDSKPIKTPMSSETKLIWDEDGESVDDTKYRGMIGAINLSKNPILHSHTKHIEIRHHFLRDNVQKGNISVEKVSSEDNIADILTKALKREPFNLLRLGLGLMEPNA